MRIFFSAMNFVDSLNEERNSKREEVELIAFQIRELQEKRDRAIAIISRLDDLISFYSREEVPSILVASQEVNTLPEEEESPVAISKRQANAAYTKLIKPEYSKMSMVDSVLQVLRQHQDEVLSIEVIAKKLAKSNLSQEKIRKLRTSISNALGIAVKAKACCRIASGAYSLKA